ncbi:polysaccharide pyruvyl transferase family protein [Methanoculleus sp.]|uniref:polysaccharide pyruvyl transferase family protein n=1 Tax=Methanoculleus sp. TaxID=90427 RepID=UPI0025F8C4F3|nr:polysaccharide pyruvyl transferase family protein [Methanoculleus sp.]MCK9320175.1 polysaccharide pyruvyl transferase family protein [Methanoculleus sp.]
MSIKAFCSNHRNVGDTLNPIILKHFLKEDIERSDDPGKILAVGSIINFAKEGDIIWGTGLIEDTAMKLPNVKVLALRGKLTADRCNLETDTYGDPGLLMPLIYKPNVVKKYKKGYTVHFIDQQAFNKDLPDDELFIDVLQPYDIVIDQINMCEHIVSSSLHGIVLAEAYGIKASYVPSYSGGVIGGSFKFKDYLTGTNRDENCLNDEILPPIKDLDKIQKDLIKKLCYFKKC